MKENKNVFHKETQYLEHIKQIQEKNTLSLEDLKHEYNSLGQEYKKLLGDTKVLTNISDRLQHRLNATYEELEVKHEEIKQKNIVLQNTIDALTKARISRKATTITLIMAVLLFILSEGFLEPFVETRTLQLGFSNNASFWIGFIAKGMIALLLKPIDYLVELYLKKEANRKNEYKTIT